MKTGFGFIAAALIALALTTSPAIARDVRHTTNKASQYFNGDDAPAAVKNMRANPRQHRRNARDKNNSNVNEDRTVNARQKHHRKNSRRGHQNNVSGGVNE